MIPYDFSHRVNFRPRKVPFLPQPAASSIPDADRPMVQEISPDRDAIPAMMIASGMMGFQRDVQEIIHQTTPAAVNRLAWTGERQATWPRPMASSRLQ